MSTPDTLAVPVEVVDKKWRISREVPLALIVTLVGQLALGIVFFTRLEGRVSTLETTVASRIQLGDQRYGETQELKVLMGRIDERTKAMSDSQKRVEDELRARKP